MNLHSAVKGKKRLVTKEPNLGLKDQSICFTGAVPGFTRSQLERLCKKHKAVFQKGVTSTTTLVVKGDSKYGEGRTTVKEQKARDRGVKIISAKEFLTRIGKIGP